MGIRSIQLLHLSLSLSCLCSTANRETAFVHAISSAGVMYTLTRNCSLGDFDNCGCDDSRNGQLGKVHPSLSSSRDRGKQDLLVWHPWNPEQEAGALAKHPSGCALGCLCCSRLEDHMRSHVRIRNECVLSYQMFYRPHPLFYSLPLD